ncbi:MFS transporter [Pseudoduganella sp. LjRoot289]|uniref:MFS transporter n=1 Tax=Pseudoduganella sp. LjRoot289 TaxID=3342314 RepID=UPI003ED0BC08
MTTQAIRVPLPPHARRALAALSLTVLLSSLGTSIANVALPTLAHAFGATFQQVQWVVLAYLLAITALVVSAGRLGDLFGRRRVLLAGITLFTLASALCGLSPALWQLIAARALQGVGAAFMMALGMAFVAETVPTDRTGSAMGLLGTMSAVGTALGPTLCGTLIASAGWSAIFAINVPLGSLAGLLVWRLLPPDCCAASAGRARFDGLGTLLLILALSAFALAMTLGRGNFGWLNGALLLAALAGGALFTVAERRIGAPLVHLSLFRDRALSAGFAANTLVTAVVMATLVVGPFYLSGSMALDAASVGLVMSCGPLVAAFAGVPSGRLVDRFGSQKMVNAGLAGMAVAAAAMPLMPAGTGIAGYIAPLAGITAGYALFQAANNTAVMNGVQPDQRGVFSGLLNLSRNLGLITGASAMGAVFALASGASDIAAARPEAVEAGMRATFGVAALLVLTAMAIVHASRAIVRSASAAR